MTRLLHYLTALWRTVSAPVGLRYVGADDRDVVVRSDLAVSLADLGDGCTRVELSDGTSEVVRATLGRVAHDLGWVIAEPPPLRL